MSGGVSGGQQKGSSNTNSAFNSQYSGQTSGQSAGLNTGLTAEQSAGQNSNTMNRIIGDDWLSGYSGLGNTLGQTGVTAGQQGNINALQGINSGLQNYTQSGYYGLGDLASKFGGQWAAPDPVTAQSVSAQSGAQGMDAYQNPWDKQVVDATAADYDAQSAQGLNAMRAGRDASGAFGDRAALADGQYMADSDRGRASLLSGLRQQGFNTAAGYGQMDASRGLQAAGMNQSANLAAQQFNNNMTNNRQQFDVNTGFRGDENRMQAFRDMQNNVMNQNGIQSGGVGNLMNYLNLGTNTFGQQSDGSSLASMLGSSIGTQFGAQSGASSGNTSGTSTSNTTSGQKSKGGGIGM
jgi:hypothetical protein